MRANTDWFRDARWGVFMHYLAHPASSTGSCEMTPEAWNARIDAFDAEALAAQLADSGAGYFFLTLGQNSGYVLSPNETWDRLVGRTPSRLSKRDLVADLIKALDGTGIRMMVYLPSHAPALDRQAVEGMACTPLWDAKAWQLKPGTYVAADGIDSRLTAFQQNYEAIVREWSERWGRGVHGWWIDGCYHADTMYHHDDAPNFASFAAAMKAGNPDSLVTFNTGVKFPLISATNVEDYTAGEIGAALPTAVPDPWQPPMGRYIDGAQLHILTYLGEFWGRGKPRFDGDFTAAYTRHLNGIEGVITWDVAPQENGTIDPAHLDVLRTINKKV